MPKDRLALSRRLVIRMNGATVVCSRKLKYLGVVIRSGFVFSSHFRYLKVKKICLFASLCRDVRV